MISLCQESSFLVRKRLGSDTWPISGQADHRVAWVPVPMYKRHVENKNPTSTVFIPSNEQCEQIVLSMTIFGNKSSQAHKNDENRGFCTSSYVETLRRK